MGEQSGLAAGREVRSAGTAGGGKRCPALRGSAGSVLLVLIITLVVLAALTAAILPTRFTSEMGQLSASGAMKAYYLAEAGGRYVLPRLMSLSVGTHSFKFSDGTPFFEIEKVSNALFTSTGVVNEGGFLQAWVDITYRLKSRFDYALFGANGITTGLGVTVDSYSSSGYLTDGENGAVGTNDDNLDGIAGDTVVNGAREVTADKDMTPAALPPGAASWTDKSAELFMVLNGQTVNLGPGQYYAAAVFITNFSTVNITGDVVLYVAGITNTLPLATLNINAGASLTIYAGGDLDLSRNNLVNPDQIPAHYIIYGLAGCQNIQLGSAHVSVFAPAADIIVIDNADVYGSLIGETVTARDGSQVHYDEDLQSLNPEVTCVEQYFAKD